MKYCMYCRNQLDDSCIFCGKCGKKQEWDELIDRIPGQEQGQFQNEQVLYATGGESMKSPGRNKGLIIAVCVLAVLVLALISTLSFVLLSGKKGNLLGKKDSGAKTAIEKTTKEVVEKVETTEEHITEKVDTFEVLRRDLASKEQMKVKLVTQDVSNYPTVKLYFSVEDETGETVYLNQPKIALKETLSSGQAIERNVKSCNLLKGREGISYELVADKSGSMEDDLYDMQYIMKDFVNELDYSVGDKVEFIAFDSYVMYMCTYTSNLTRLRNGIDNMTTYGETALYDALYEAVGNAGRQKGARCVIAFTDGLDNKSVHTAEEVIRLANRCSVPIFIIGTYNGDWSTYENIALSTGGNYWDISSVGDMAEVLDSISSREQNMYCLEYISDGKANPYATRDISCIFEDEVYGCQANESFTPVKIEKQKNHKSRYEVIKDDVSWEEANEECISRGGHLITITSSKEMKRACKLAKKAGLQFVWMGGYTSVRGEQTYGHWITGEDFNYQKWYPGEPSRTDTDGAEEMYLMLWQIQGKWSWNDQRNDPVHDTELKYFKGKTGYICEYDN